MERGTCNLLGFIALLFLVLSGVNMIFIGLPIIQSVSAIYMLAYTVLIAILSSKTNQGAVETIFVVIGGLITFGLVPIIVYFTKLRKLI
ncbi:hypothetical protein KAJ38_03345 [Candidatus Pacearchaeota archaeon]|nr:hypothetical protein [Candidatus Pacearchaeota archaeon]